MFEPHLLWVQPAGVQPSRGRKCLDQHKKARSRDVNPAQRRARGAIIRGEGVRVEAQGTYPDHWSSGPQREQSGVRPHERSPG
jgi:hypothetical protein